MKSSAKKIELASVDDLFSTEEGRQDAKLEKIQEIPLSELHPFKNHPFKVKDDEAMMETADSIKKPSTEQDKTDKIDPLQLTHLLWRLHEFFQFLVGNAIVQQPFLQGIGDQADFFMVPHHTGFTTVISYIVLHFIFV